MRQAALLALLACGLASAAQAQGAGPSNAGASIAGTYAVSICPAGCDAAHPPVTGVLVLAQTPLPTPPRTARRYLGGGELEHGRHANACFVLDRAGEPPTHAGIEPVGLTRWTRGAADSLSVGLFASVDASYAITVRVAAGSLSGRGTSFSAGIGATSRLDDRVSGERTGPADPAPCFRAAAAEQKAESETAGNP